MAKKHTKNRFFNFKKWFERKPKKMTKAQKATRKELFAYTFKAVLVIAALIGIVVGLLYLERFVVVKRGIGKLQVPLELVNCPDWVSDELLAKIYEIAGSETGTFVLNDDTADKVGSNLSNFSWLYDVRVQVELYNIKVDCGYYKPLLVVEKGGKKNYLAADMPLDYEDFDLVVLQYVPIYKLPIIELTGLNSITTNVVGSKCQKPEALAAAKLIRLLSLMDKNLQDKYEQSQAIFKPLLSEIKSVDVSNYNSSKSSSQSALILYANDGTPIYWGSLEGNLEAVPAEKLGKLYQYYRDYGTIQARSRGDAKYIDLRIAEKILPLP